MGWLELLLSLKEMRMEPRKIETEFLFEVRIPQGPHHLIGDGPLGHRRITYPKAGAKVRGPRLNGEVLEGGGDPFLMRADGVGEVDARITIRSEAGDVIMMSYKGVVRYSEEFTEAQKRGELASQEGNYFYVSVLFETASDNYRWLNGTLGVARGFIPEDLPSPCIGYQVFAVR